jgi:hypothetical protein
MQQAATLYQAELAENLAHASPPDLDLPRSLSGSKARIHLPYRSGLYRSIRILGMLTLLASSLGLLAAVAGLPLNGLTMLLGLLVSLVLIGFTVRPSLRRPQLVVAPRDSRQG